MGLCHVHMKQRKVWDVTGAHGLSPDKPSRDQRICEDSDERNKAKNQLNSILDQRTPHRCFKTERACLPTPQAK